GPSHGARAPECHVPRWAPSAASKGDVELLPGEGSRAETHRACPADPATGFYERICPRGTRHRPHSGFLAVSECRDASVTDFWRICLSDARIRQLRGR